MGMIGLACSSLSCDGFVDIHFQRTFEIAPQIGFKSIEFNCWHPSDLTPQSTRRYAATEVATWPASDVKSSRACAQEMCARSWRRARLSWASILVEWMQRSWPAIPGRWQARGSKLERTRRGGCGIRQDCGRIGEGKAKQNTR